MLLDVPDRKRRGEGAGRTNAVTEQMKRMILRVEGYKRTQIDMIG